MVEAERRQIAVTWRWQMPLTVIFCLCGMSQTFAQSGNHGDGHAEMHDVYKGWNDRRGFSCCDKNDCRPVRADADIEGRWRAWVNGRWAPVPADTVLPIQSPDGRSHICWSPGALEPRCFVPGEPRS